MSRTVLALWKECKYHEAVGESGMAPPDEAMLRCLDLRVAVGPKVSAAKKWTREMA